MDLPRRGSAKDDEREALQHHLAEAWRGLRVHRASVDDRLGEAIDCGDLAGGFAVCKSRLEASVSGFVAEGL